VISCAIQITGVLSCWVRWQSALETQLVSVERVLEYCKLKPEEEKQIVPSDSGKIDVNQKLSGIEFKDVNLRYDEDSGLVLKNVTDLSTNTC